MQRRDALKLIAGAAALPLLSGSFVALCQEAHAQATSRPARRLFDAHQDATVTTIAELILPQTDTPGAKAARVNEFIDLILADWAEDEHRAAFLAGLADVDIRSRALFGKDFVDCAEPQQKDILTELDAEVARLREEKPPENARRPRPGKMEKNFFYMMKRLTLVGYYTSEIGATEELRLQHYFRRYQGCAPLAMEAESAGN